MSRLLLCTEREDSAALLLEDLDEHLVRWADWWDGIHPSEITAEFSLCSLVVICRVVSPSGCASLPGRQNGLLLMIAFRNSY